MEHSMKIREYKKEDEGQIKEALKSISGIDSEQWCWKFFGNPNRDSQIWIIDEDGILIGHMALICMKLRVNGSDVDGCQAVDLFIDKNHRGKGLFVSLGKTILENAGEIGISVAFGFPNHEALGGHLKYGWKNIGTIQRGLKPLDIKQFAKMNKKSPLTMSIYMGIKSRKKKIPINEFTVTHIHEFDKSIDSFVSKNLKYRNAVLRTSNYLNWRYCQAPHRDYIKFLATDKNGVVGYIVGSETKKAPGIGYIVDIFVKEGDIIAARTLLETLEKYYKSKKIFALHAWIPNFREYEVAFKDSGFIQRKPTQPFIVRVNREFIDMDYVFDIDKWFITMGDSDLH